MYCHSSVLHTNSQPSATCLIQSKVCNIHNALISCNRGLLDKHVVKQLPKQLPTFYAAWRLTAVFTRPTTGSWAISWNQSILSHSVYFMIPFNISLPTYHRSLNWPLPLGFSKILYEFLISTMHIQEPPCPPYIILLSQQYLVDSTNYDTPHYGVFSVLLLLLSLKSTCSPQCLIFQHITLHSLRHLKFHNHTHEQEKFVSFLGF